MRYSKASIIHLVIIAAIGFLAYSNTFNAPFHLDDYQNIVKNPVIKDLSYYVEPSRARDIGFTDFAQYPALVNRYVGSLSFALNYRMHGLKVEGYHAVNLAVHVLNAFLAYWLVLLTFRTPHLNDSKQVKDSKQTSMRIALVSALLFVSHPVQTQAVTYIVQRFASLATMFYLLSLVLYVKSRLGEIKLNATAPDRHSRQSGNPETSMRKPREPLDSCFRRNDKIVALLLYLGALLCAALAMKTKEIAFTLPVVIGLYEFMFFRDGPRGRALRLVPVFMIMVIIMLSRANLDMLVGSLSGGANGAAMARDILRLEYLLTEFTVVVAYLRLLVLPLNQNLDYDYPIYHSFLDPPVFLSFLFLLALFGFGVYLLYRSRVTDNSSEFGVRSSEIHSSLITHHSSRLAAFGIFWFFITLSVESSVIPLHPIFEHRVYLPSVGIIIAAVSGAMLLLEKSANTRVKTAGVYMFVVMAVVFSTAAYARNNVWKSETGLWEDVVRKSPQKADAHKRLGDAYLKEGRNEKAIKYFQNAIRLAPGYADAHSNLGAAYKSEGLMDKAVEHFRIAIKLKPDIAEAYNNLGSIYESRGLTDKAMGHYEDAISARPNFAEAHYNLGAAFASKGMTDEAIRHYEFAVKISPDMAMAHNNLGAAYASKGLIDKAIEHQRAVLKLKPDSVNAHFNLGLTYFKKGDFDSAREEFKTALEIDPRFGKARRTLDQISTP